MFTFLQARCLISIYLTSILYKGLTDKVKMLLSFKFNTKFLITNDIISNNVNRKKNLRKMHMSIMVHLLLFFNNSVHLWWHGLPQVCKTWRSMIDQIHLCASCTCASVERMRLMEYLAFRTKQWTHSIVEIWLHLKSEMEIL